MQSTPFFHFPFVSIVAPTYNEVANIAQLFDRVVPVVERICSQLETSCEVLFVDDNSPDGTAARIQEYAERFPQVTVKLVTRPEKQGLGTAIVRGIRSSPARIIVVLDSDLSHPPELIPRMIEAITNGHQVAIGSRYIRGGSIEEWPASRRFMSQGATLMARALFRLRTRDPISGFFAVRSELLRGLELTGQCYKVLLEILVQVGDQGAMEIPYRFSDRKDGRSKLGLREVMDYIRLLWSLMRRRRQMVRE